MALRDGRYSRPLTSSNGNGSPTKVTNSLVWDDAPSGDKQNTTKRVARPQQSRTAGLMFGGNNTSPWGKVGNMVGPMFGPMGVGQRNSNNPWGWTGWGQPWLGTSDTYDWILRHPKVQHVRQDILNPIQESRYEVEADEGVEVEVIDQTLDMFMNLRRKYTDDAMRALDYGCAPFEVVWRKQGKYTIISDIVPLPTGATQILKDGAGNFAGVRPPQWVDGANGSFSDYLGVLYSTLFTFNGKFNNLHGQSILENIRETAWRGWLKAFNQIDRLGDKISGTLGMLLYPAGKYQDQLGNEVSFEDSAKAAVEGLMKNQFVLMQNLALSGATPREMGEFAAQSLVELKIVDAGNQASAISGLVAEMLHFENLISEGMLQSPRVNSDSNNGSRGDADRHTITAVRFSEKLNIDMTESLTRPWYGPVNNFLAINWGEDYRGRVRLRAVPINDERVAGYRAFITTVCNVPQIAAAYVLMADNRKMLNAIGLPVKNEMDPVSIESLKNVAPTAAASPSSSAPTKTTPVK